MVIFYKLADSTSPPPQPTFFKQQRRILLTPANFQALPQEIKTSRVGIARTLSIRILTHSEQDLLTPTVYWPMIESSLGIVGACLPLLRPILTDTRIKSIFSSLCTILSRSSSLSNSANVKAMEYAKMEARGFRNPQVHTIENVDMV